MLPRRLVLHLLRRSVRRPRLFGLLLRTAWRFRARDWYRRAPFLPLPPAEYLAWRLHTAYGEGGAQPDAAELERYLDWVERMNRYGSRTANR